MILTSGGGLFTAISNGIPLRVGSIPNDAHNVIAMRKDKDSRDSFYLQLKVNGLLSKGIRLKDMEYDQFRLEENIDYKKPLNFARIFIKHNYYLDKMDFEGARKALDFADRYVGYTLPIYRMELEAESLFLELIGDCNRGKIEKLYHRNLRKYIDDSQFMLNKKRIMMAYELLYKKDYNKGLEYFEELKEVAEQYPIKGEVDMEIMLGEYLLEIIE